jgi:hypothetical protein
VAVANGNQRLEVTRRRHFHEGHPRDPRPVPRCRGPIDNLKTERLFPSWLETFGGSDPFASALAGGRLEQRLALLLGTGHG